MSIPAPKRLRPIFLALAVGGFCVTVVSTVWAQQESDAGTVHVVSDTYTEQEALALLLREAARDVAAAAAACGSGPVLLLVMPENAPPVLRQVLAEELMQRGIGVRTTAGDERCRLTVEARGMRSSAVSMGNSSYLRKIVATLGFFLEQGDGNVVYSQERLLERSDTLRGEAPYSDYSYLDEDSSWWDALLEPALATATAIVIAVLLFTVRGSS
jgi:hypothetical protein